MPAINDLNFRDNWSAKGQKKKIFQTAKEGSLMHTAEIYQNIRAQCKYQENQWKQEISLLSQPKTQTESDNVIVLNKQQTISQNGKQRITAPKEEGRNPRNNTEEDRNGKMNEGSYEENKGQSSRQSRNQSPRFETPFKRPQKLKEISPSKIFIKNPVILEKLVEVRTQSPKNSPRQQHSPRESQPTERKRVVREANIEFMEPTTHEESTNRFQISLKRVYQIRRGQIISQLQRKKKEMNRRLDTDGSTVSDINSLIIGGERQQLHERNTQAIKLNNQKYERRFKKAVHQEEEGEYYLSKVVQSALGEGSSPKKKLPLLKQEPRQMSSKIGINIHIKRKASFDGSYIKEKRRMTEERDISSARGTERNPSLKLDLAEEMQVEMKYGFNYKNDILNGGGGLDPSQEGITGWN